MRLPKRSHLFPPALVGILQGAGWMLEQGVSGASAWANVPFGWLTALVLTFWAGLVVQDFYNKRSWIHENWRLAHKIFEIDALHSTHIVEEPERIAIRALLRFARKVSKGRIVVSVYPQYINAHPFVILDEKLAGVPPHDSKALILCNLPIQKPGWTPIHAVWGADVGTLDIKPDQKVIAPHSENIVVIVVTAGWRKQSFRFLARFTDPSRADESRIQLWWGDEHLGPA